MCQMVKQAGVPAARGPVEDSRVAGKCVFGEEGGAVTSKSALSSAGVFDYVTSILL